MISRSIAASPAHTAPTVRVADEKLLVTDELHATTKEVFAGFFFASPEPAAVMEVVELSPHDRVRWRCVGGVAEWVGTTVTFELKESGGETVLLFTHADWREPVEFMHHCTTKWATVLLGLKSGLEGSAFTSFPDDTRVSTGWR